MIAIFSENVNHIFLKKFNMDVEFVKNIDEIKNLQGLFIDWVPKLPEYENTWMKQASLLQLYIKSNIPIVIFDRFFSLDEKEVEFVKKYNVHLFEPALYSDRSGFEYLPEWIDESIIQTKYDDKRKFDFVYSHNKIEYQITEFEKWIMDYARVFPDKKVGYATNIISDFKKEEYKTNNLIKVEKYPIYKEGKTTIVIDKERAYKIGYLNHMYLYAMTVGCLPFLPAKHKYFHGLFKGLIVNNINELNMGISMFAKVRDVCIEEILKRLTDEWSEFTIDHATDVIRNKLK